MSVKIGMSVLFAFIIVFSILFFLHFSFPDPNVIHPDHQFFLQKFDPHEKKIFLIGSSHVGQMNNTYVVEKINQRFDNYTLYNLAIGGDKPFLRSKLIKPTISLHPEIIFYGISYRDFMYQNEENVLPDLKQITDETLLITNTELNSIKPKSTTLRALLTLPVFSEITQNKNRIPIQHSPFFTLEKGNLNISNFEKIQKFTENLPEKSSIPQKSLQTESFEKIISAFKKNNIEIIIFITPVHKNYIENISEKEKNNFNLILQNISQKYNVKIYDFSQNYIDKQSWENLTHLAYNKKSSFYYDDIAEMITKEIEE